MADKSKRREQLDSAIDSASGSLQERDMPGVKASDNPYPPGSSRAKFWERRRVEGKLPEQKKK